jgi:hypothetical protein
MKKNLIAMLVVSVLLVLGSLTTIFASSTSNTINLKMTVFAAGFLSVTNTDGNGFIRDAGAIAQGNTNVWLGTSGVRGVFKNNGTQVSTYSLKAAVFTNGVQGFTLVSGKPNSGQVRAAVIFGEWDQPYAKIDFLTDDCLTGAYVLCTTQVFAKESGFGSGDAFKGFAVGSGTDRNMLFSMCYGGGLADGSNLTVKIWVKAQ